MQIAAADHHMKHQRLNLSIGCLLLALAACGDAVSPVSPTARPAPSPAGQPAPPAPTAAFHWSVVTSVAEGDGTGSCRNIAGGGISAAAGTETVIRFEPSIWETHGACGAPEVRITVAASLRLEEGYFRSLPVTDTILDTSGIPLGWGYETVAAPSTVSPKEPTVSPGRVRIPVGGYGEIAVLATTETDSASLRVEIPGQNYPDVDLVSSPYSRFVLPGPPPTRSVTNRCDPTLREDALSYTGHIWQDWRLPIPVDVVDNFPKDHKPMGCTDGPDGERRVCLYRDRVDPYAVLEQINDYAEQMEDAMGFRVLTPGRVIGEAEADRSRPRMTERFHIEYGAAECSCYTCIAEAHISNGFAYWCIRAHTEILTTDSGGTGEIAAVAHELEHLLGFKHPYDPEDKWSLAMDGVPMVYPQVRYFLPGMKYWTGRDYYDEYRVWDESRYTAPETLQNLYCIFRDQR